MPARNWTCAEAFCAEPYNGRMLDDPPMIRSGPEAQKLDFAMASMKGPAVCRRWAWIALRDWAQNTLFHTLWR